MYLLSPLSAMNSPRLSLTTQTKIAPVTLWLYFFFITLTTTWRRLVFVYIHRATSTSLIRVWAPSGSRTQQLETYIVLKGVSAAAAAKSLLSCLTLCDPIDSIPRGSRPWDSPGKNTGVGCHFLLQCMKVRSESEVAQSCPTLSDPMDWSPPGSSVHGIFQARVLEWGAIAFST